MPTPYRLHWLRFASNHCARPPITLLSKSTWPRAIGRKPVANSSDADGCSEKNSASSRPIRCACCLRKGPACRDSPQSDMHRPVAVRRRERRHHQSLQPHIAHRMACSHQIPRHRRTRMSCGAAKCHHGQRRRISTADQRVMRVGLDYQCAAGRCVLSMARPQHRMVTTVDISVGAQSFAVREDAFAAFWARVAAGDWEPDSFAVIDRLVAPGTTFIDIGAWIGPLTLYTASVAGTVHAIEPDPAARAVLRANIELNPWLAERVRVHAVAIGDRTGPGRLGNITSARGGDSMSSLLYADAPVSWEVDCTTLDRFLTAVDGPVPSLIKIETEGTEVELLDAARDWLAATRPPLLLSVHARFWPDPYPRLTRLVDLLSSYQQLLTPWLSPIDPRTLLDDEHAHGMFELVAL